MFWKKSQIVCNRVFLAKIFCHGGRDVGEKEMEDVQGQRDINQKTVMLRSQVENVPIFFAYFIHASLLAEMTGKSPRQTMPTDELSLTAF